MEQRNLYLTTVCSVKIMFCENQLQRKKNSKAKDDHGLVDAHEVQIQEWTFIPTELCNVCSGFILFSLKTWITGTLISLHWVSLLESYFFFTVDLFNCIYSSENLDSIYWKYFYRETSSLGEVVAIQRWLLSETAEKP